MKINCGPKKIHRDLEQWHHHFIIWPRRLVNEECRAFEMVMRRLVVDCEDTWAGGYLSHWEYEAML
jgi:hypothetical protein